MKRWILALGIGAAIFGIVFALAASLGGVTTTSLGASATSVPSCDTNGVTTSYNVSYSGSPGAYRVDSVTVNGIAAPQCNGKQISVTLTAGGTNVGDGSTTITGGAGPTDSSQVVPITSATKPTAEQVDDVHILING